MLKTSHNKNLKKNKNYYTQNVGHNYNNKMQIGSQSQRMA